jgi:UDP-2,3-diacylglucosamine pyrophosphatase LpxH
MSAPDPVNQPSVQDGLASHVVLFFDDGNDDDELPLGFICKAEDTEHAEEQCHDAYPGCDVVFVHRGDTVDEALTEYCKD